MIHAGDVLDRLRTASKADLSNKERAASTVANTSGSLLLSSCPVQAPLSSSAVVGAGGKTTHSIASGLLMAGQAVASKASLASPGCERVLKALAANAATAGHPPELVSIC
jgi:hypothetical protein